MDYQGFVEEVLQEVAEDYGIEEYELNSIDIHIWDVNAMLETDELSLKVTYGSVGGHQNEYEVKVKGVYELEDMERKKDNRISGLSEDDFPEHEVASTINETVGSLLE
ncbi:MAG: hypothetical protein ACI9LV_000371 [Candidatus Nanohaloarchaea archaeon]|jgi:hypothetical protein